MGLLWMIYTPAPPMGRSDCGIFFDLLRHFSILRRITREPDPQLGFIAFGWLTMGQLLSVALSLVGVGMLFYICRCANLREAQR